MQRFAFLLALAVATPAAASSWDIDTSHSMAGFVAKHLVFTKVHGRFNTWSGSVTLDDKDITKSKVDVKIDASSINTENEKRDTHLKSPDFFDAAKFKDITFKSTKIEKGDKPNFLKVTGDLTMHGVTKPITLDVELSDEWTDPKDWGGNTHKGVHAVGTINRKDFGLNWQKQLDKGGVVAGDEVKLLIDAELVKKKPAA
jgi:polyisoprenoid-binding protein YceI